MLEVASEVLNEHQHNDVDESDGDGSSVDMDEINTNDKEAGGRHSLKSRGRDSLCIKSAAGDHKVKCLCRRQACLSPFGQRRNREVIPYIPSRRQRRQDAP